MRRILRRVARVAPLAIVGVLALDLPPDALAKTTRLRLASDAWPPFTNVAGEPRVALELVHEGLRRAGVEADSTILTWSEAMAGLADGRFDGSAAIWRSPDREKILLFSDAYLENRLVLVGAKGSDVGATSLAALAGKRVAVVAQYAYGESVEGAPGPTLVEGSSDQQNLDALLGGRVDYLLVDDLLIRYLVEQRPEEVGRRLEIGATPLVRRSLHFAVRRELPGADALIARFDEQIGKMLADGTYNTILRLDWIHADVDDDGQPELVSRAKHAGAVAPTAGYSILANIPRETSVRLELPKRYWIDGRVYESWDDVPERYKTKPKSDSDKPPPVLLRF